MWREEDLPFPCTLLQSSTTDRKSVVVNMPLLSPASHRLFLSDGSLPLQSAVSPPELAATAPFDAYSPRPFASVCLALDDIAGSTQACVRQEILRLGCLQQLLQSYEWNVCLFRITAFDLLSHVFGADFLTADNLICADAIHSLIEAMQQTFREIQRRSADTRLCLVSAYSHVDCIARLNINQLLKLGGFCQVAERHASPADESSRRRLQAAKAVHQLLLSDADEKEPIVSAWNGFECAATVAASPLQNCIFVNDKERFADGVVESAAVQATCARVRDYLSHELAKMFGAAAQVLRPTKKSPASPDLIAFVEGVEQHDSIKTDIVDFVNKPRSTHAPRGFAFLPGSELDNPQTMDIIELSRSVLELTR